MTGNGAWRSFVDGEKLARSLQNPAVRAISALHTFPFHYAPGPSTGSGRSCRPVSAVVEMQMPRFVKVGLEEFPVYND